MDDFIKVATLGKGRFASVGLYKRKSCNDSERNNDKSCKLSKKYGLIAAKIFSRSTLVDKGMVGNVMREKATLQEIKKTGSNYLCELIETRKNDTELYILMEPYFGGTLSNFIRQAGTLSINIVRKLTKQLCSALFHLGETVVYTET